MEHVRTSYPGRAKGVQANIQEVKQCSEQALGRKRYIQNKKHLNILSKIMRQQNPRE